MVAGTLSYIWLFAATVGRVTRLSPNVPLSAQVADQLRRRIAEGEFPVGALLPTENELSQQLGISRNSVREAVRSLVHAGILGARAGYGTFVVAASDLAPTLARRLESDTGRDVAEVRTMLEREGARFAAARATDEQRQELRRVLDERAQATDGPTYVELDRRFHELVFEASGNALLAELYRGTGGNERALAWVDSPEVVVAEVGLLEVDRAHADLVEAIEAGDPEAAASVAERLVRLAYEHPAMNVEGERHGG
ncbi:GntR family transcriptional regulator [Cnuibacter physcomitrellae]|nr:GntR family transcriptional regulator [Cnuibacter physcomitrellae]